MRNCTVHLFVRAKIPSLWYSLIFCQYTVIQGINRVGRFVTGCKSCMKMRANSSRVTSRSEAISAHQSPESIHVGHGFG